jgi:CheY-like chemotaxis protein
MCGYKVEVASNGRDAVRLFDRDRIEVDLVVTDINMPDMSGNDVARHIRNSPKPETPIIAITGTVGEIDDPNLFNTILNKPFKLSALGKVIRLFLQSDQTAATAYESRPSMAAS